MTNNELERAWNEIESKQHDNAKYYQRLICSDLLYRVYIGVTGIPARRYIIFEIPKEEKEQFNAFVEPRGFSLSLDNTIIKHDGFVSSSATKPFSESVMLMRRNKLSINCIARYFRSVKCSKTVSESRHRSFR